MATLAELHRELFPAAEPVAALEPGQGERVVGWVRTLKARVPAFDALEADDLALVPISALSIVAGGASDLAALAEALLRAHVAGVLVLDGGGDEAALTVSFGRALVDHGVAGYILTRGSGPAGGSAGGAGEGSGAAVFGPDGGTEAAGLERAIIGYLVNRRAEFERQAALLEAQLGRLALQSSDLATLVGAIGGFLERAVALEGRRGDALAVQAPADVPDAAAAATAYIAGPRAARLRSAALRVSLPAASDGDRSPGALVLLGDRPASELERVVAERIAGLLALEIARTESVSRARDEARRSEALPGDGPPWVVLVARQVVPDLPADIAEREETRRELRRLAPARRLALRGDPTSLELRLVLAADLDDPGGLGLAGRVAAFLGRTVAVSRAFTHPTDRAAAEADARATLEAADGLPVPPPVALAARLPAYRLLGNVHNVPDGQRQARALLEPVLGGSPAAVHDRLATLRALLDRAGIAEAAAALDVHRNTVAYRVRRIEAITGWNLDDPDLRFALALALRLVQEEQS
ncbi:MAG TPA: helix-turn-helix domain-containing protein [Candidatus Binatia bacterium]|nr:helix-turn-helix domain-containing protein [Candidatus Binatia bacterium]